MLMKLDLRQLRHLLALDQYRNFARAADAIGLSQPALSRSLQVLEKSVGARLFDRDRARVEPTPVGVRLVERARSLLSQVTGIESELQQLLGLEVGMLRLGAGSYPADISVGTAVGRLIGRHPGLRVDLSIGDWPALTGRVLSGDLDLAVAEGSIALADDRLAVEPLPAHQIVFFCRPGHPLVGRGSLSLAELRQYPLVAPALPARLRPLVAPAGAAPQLDLPADAMAPESRGDTLQLTRHIVMQSDAVSGALPSQIERDIELGQLVALPLQLPWIKTSYAMIRLAGRTPSPVAEAFMQVLREVEAGIP
jgi:DNA-binding transcriptional LysR family regulator